METIRTERIEVKKAVLDRKMSFQNEGCSYHAQCLQLSSQGEITNSCVGRSLSALHSFLRPLALRIARRRVILQRDVLQYGYGYRVFAGRGAIKEILNI